MIMKTTVTLSYDEIKEACLEYVKNRSTIRAKNVILTYSPGYDAREVSTFTATVSE